MNTYDPHTSLDAISRAAAADLMCSLSYPHSE
jgi:hypothetical protein